MANFGKYMDFEMEEAHEHSRSQTSFEPSSPYIADGQFQRPIIRPPGLPIPNWNFEGTMKFAIGQPQSMFTPQTSFEPPAFHVNSSLIPSDSRPGQDWSSFRQNNVFYQVQDNLLVNNPPQSRQNPSQSSTRKRAPKAPTMSAKSWKPCESRIKQLYMNDGKSIEKLREIINEEFRLVAT
jgi:hypothetical protein